MKQCEDLEARAAEALQLQNEAQEAVAIIEEEVHKLRDDSVAILKCEMVAQPATLRQAGNH